MSISANFNSAVSSIMQGSSAMNDMIAKAPPEQQDFLRAQQKMQQEEQITQLISKAIASFGKQADSVIQNMGR
ncbi:hypothetical protein LZ198_01925 [Myxococcus sp. K15C18031901]|uniref:hypothetical protein n=1 Tax=Myxococcus dinghuensis TaxID=2906761 RepID=UPI0020A73D14|nr:hypothetical protein [Myxococcus dinghuensis]MCP3097629.1 hypothetical protein [Myxococcus dinghuensis]